MTHERLIERQRIMLVPFVTLITLSIPLVVWVISVGNPSDYFTHRVPPGQALYALSKLSGLIVLLLYWVQCMTALARFSPALRGFVRLSRSQHIWLGSTTFLLVITHLALFVAASTLRTHHLALDLLLPNFNSGFFSAYLSVGVLAFWGLVVAILAGWRRSRGHAAWIWLHRGVLVMFALGFLHGIAIGSETRFGPMTYVYAFLGLSLAAALFSAVWLELKRRVQLRRMGLHTTNETMSGIG